MDKKARKYPLEHVSTVDYPSEGRLLFGVVFKLQSTNGCPALYVLTKAYADGSFSVMLSKQGPNGHWVAHGRIRTDGAEELNAYAARKAVADHLDALFKALGAEPDMFTQEAAHV